MPESPILIICIRGKTPDDHLVLLVAILSQEILEVLEHLGPADLGHVFFAVALHCLCQKFQNGFAKLIAIQIEKLNKSPEILNSSEDKVEVLLLLLLVYMSAIYLAPKVALHRLIVAFAEQL